MLRPPRSLKQALHAWRQRLFIDVVIVRGRWSAGDPPVTVLLGMPRGSVARGYFQGLLEGDAQTLYAGRVMLPRLQRWVQRMGVDLCLLERPPSWVGLPSAALHLRAPRLVRQQIELTGALEQVRKRFRDRNKTVFNKFARGERFAVRVSRSGEDFVRFYDQMFLPHVQRQFGGLADLDTREALQAVFERGFLMIASLDGLDVGATLCHETGGALCYHRVGTLEGDPRWIREGVQSALYVHMMLHARSRSLDRLDLGMSRSFFDDGIYRHKRNWGAVVSVEDDERGVLHIVQPGPGPALAQMLDRHPLIGFSAHGLVACVGGAAPTERAECQRLYGAAGLVGVCRLDQTGSGFEFEPFEAAAPSGPV